MLGNSVIKCSRHILGDSVTAVVLTASGLGLQAEIAEAEDLSLPNGVPIPAGRHSSDQALEG